MATLLPTLEDNDYRNWVKGGLGLKFARDGIVVFVKKNIDKFHEDVMKSLPPGQHCDNCSTENTVPCKSNSLYKYNNNFCKFSKNNCTVHDPKNPSKKGKKCPNSVCNNIRDAIVEQHRFNGPSWRNTDSSRWCREPWQLATCYMPEGYQDASSSSETDFPGLLSIVINNNVFDTVVAASLRNKNNVFCKARETRNDILHNVNMRMSDAELARHITVLDDMLSDTKCLAGHPRAVEARALLAQIRNDTLSVSADANVILAENPCIRFQLTNMDGKLKHEDMYQLEQWIGTGPKTFNLLYKITRDGCDATTFHQKCDDQGATVTVLYNRQGSVFGGYISQSWNSSGIWNGDENTFLYQLHFNGSSTARKFPCTNTINSYYGCSTYGPTFGIGHDLFTFKNSIAKSGEYFSLNGYMHFGCDYDSKGIQADQINNGNMDVMELEVYKLTSMVCHLQDKDMKQLEQWIGTGSKIFTLLSKITRDGCHATTFHQKCDDQGATVTVLYNRQGSVFGGYISQSWNSSGKWIGDENAFLYQLHFNGSSTARKFPCKNTTESFYGCSTYGPTFGIGHDLFTFKNSVAKSGECFALNGYMHFGLDYDSQGIQADQINIGNMDVIDLEVYKLTNIANRLQYKDMKQLEQWIGTGRKSFTLLYKITTNGCHATTFHHKCDNQGATVTVLYNRQGSVFGGYISQSWNSSGKWIGDENAFLYQLQFNGSSTARQFPCKNTKESYYGCNTYGPTFGISHDLFTFKNSIAKSGEYFHLNGYMHFGRDFDAQGIQANQINNGNMDVIDLEVYKVEKGRWFYADARSVIRSVPEVFSPPTTT